MWDKLSSAGKIIVVVLLGVMLLIPMAVLIKVNPGPWVCLDVGLMIGLYALFEYLSHKKTEKYIAYAEALEKSMDGIASMKDGVLVVKKLSPKLYEALTYTADSLTTLEHEDARYIYTSATVGGVTTGGVTKVGDRDYLKTTATGKYCMRYLGKDIVERIELKPELYEKAKKSKISKYLDNKNAIIVVEMPKSQKDVEALLEINAEAALKRMQQNIKSGYPSKTKCIDIIDWLSSEN